MTKCYLCEKGVLKVKEVPYTIYGEPVGNFKGEVCEQCGETFFDEDVSKKMTEIAKKKGLWGLQAKTKIGQAGTTLDIRLPKRIIESLPIKLDCIAIEGIKKELKSEAGIISYPASNLLCGDRNQSLRAPSLMTTSYTFGSWPYLALNCALASRINES